MRPFHGRWMWNSSHHLEGPLMVWQQLCLQIRVCINSSSSHTSTQDLIQKQRSNQLEKTEKPFLFHTAWTLLSFPVISLSRLQEWLSGLLTVCVFLSVFLGLLWRPCGGVSVCFSRSCDPTVALRTPSQLLVSVALTGSVLTHPRTHLRTDWQTFLSFLL